MCERVRKKKEEKKKKESKPLLITFERKSYRGKRGGSRVSKKLA